MFRRIDAQLVHQVQQFESFFSTGGSQTEGDCSPSRSVLIVESDVTIGLTPFWLDSVPVVN